MSLHDSLLLALESVAEVRLQASLRDERLLFERDDDIRIFIPDLHLLSDRARPRYSYGTNHAGLLGQVIDVIRQLKVSEAGKGKVIVYQLGDLFDLWREVAQESERVDAANQISDSHPEVVHPLFAPDLKARFVLGNHDFELYRWPNYIAWERRYFLTYGGLEKPRGVVLHGDIFDWVEHIPDMFNRWVVYYLSPFKAASDYDLTEALAVVHRENALHDFSQQIAGDAAIGELMPRRAAAFPPARFNVTADHKYLGTTREACQRLNKAYDLQMRFTVIGHTHRARISVHDGGGDDFFALIDTGCWVENSILPDGTRLPNAQLTAICGNEIRIYLLGPRNP